MAEKIPAKDRALNPDRIMRIGGEIEAVFPAFDTAAFAADVLTDLPNLELKARIARTAQGLHDHLPIDGAEALDVLVRSLPPTPQAAGLTNDFGLHIYSPHSDYVARYCRTPDLVDAALDALRQFTRYFSAEDAVRHFLNDFPQPTMKAINAWAKDEYYRVRRLASESTRPTLPWSVRINLATDAALPILHQLHGDTSRYVTQSVANHLRDISATEPDRALATLKTWRAEGRSSAREFDFIARETLKNLLKKGWPPAYDFLGYPTDATLDLSPLHLERADLTEDEALTFSANLASAATTTLYVTYIISSATQRGARREKVYFLTKATVAPGNPLRLTKQHRLRSTATTRITPGSHLLEIQVNGRRFPGVPFNIH